MYKKGSGSVNQTDRWKGNSSWIWSWTWNPWKKK